MIVKNLVLNVCARGTGVLVELYTPPSELGGIDRSEERVYSRSSSSSGKKSSRSRYGPPNPTLSRGSRILNLILLYAK